jgi:hypothetical protein
MLRRVRRYVVVAASAALLAPVIAEAAPAPSSQQTTTTVGFAVPTVVDQYRPGFEPSNATVPTLEGDPYAGSTFVSMPNGFSTTMSYIWRSDDGRQSFHPTEGNVFGKTTTCYGGGDTELQVDPVNGNLYFADLQGLTNFSTSASSDAGHTWNTTCFGVPGVGVDRQWEAIDDNGGKSAVGPGPNDGRIYLDYDNVDQDPTGQGNQLVMNESLDGVHFGNTCQGTNAAGPTVSGCALPPAVISPDESIPGNVIVDNVATSPYQHRIFAIHTGDSGSSVIVSWCSGASGDNTAATVGQDCTDPTKFTPGQNANDPLDRTNSLWHDSFVQKPGHWETGQLFPSIAIDTAGNLYAAWSQYPLDSSGNVDGPGQILLSVSTDGAKSWSAPVTVSQANINEAVMPWITAGDPGRVGVAYYAADDTRDGNVGPDASNGAVWNLFYAFTTGGLSSAPTFSHNQVNEPGHPIKYGDISTGGLGGTEDRSLGDFFQVHTGPQGQAIISYVDDTSADRNADTCGGCGETPPEAAGPVMVATQNNGPSLYTKGEVPSIPTWEKGTVTVGATQAAKDAFLAAGGQDVPAAANQQLLGASVKQSGSNLVVTLNTADSNLANDLSVSPTLGGPVGEWMVRWAAPAYSAQSTGYKNCPEDGSNTCDGNIFYVGMESAGGGAPTFYTGTTQAITSTHAKYFVYPATTAITGSVKGSTITWTVPVKDVGSPAGGQGLYSITGFTATQLTPSPSTTVNVPANNGEAGDFNIPNLISATPAFDYLLPGGSSTGTSGGGNSGGGNSGGGNSGGGNSGGGNSGGGNSGGGGTGGGGTGGTGSASGPTWSSPVELQGKLNGGEPSLVFDPSSPNYAYVVAPQAIPAASNALIGGTNTNGVGFWASSNGAQSFGSGINIGSTVGGGDSDVAVDPKNGSVYTADLEAVAADICKSSDHGQSFTSGNALAAGDACNAVTTNQQGPEDDRPWLNVGPDSSVYLTYHDLAFGAPIVERSTDGGATFTPCGSILDPQGPAGQNYSPEQGTLVAKPAISPDGSMYVEVTEPPQTSTAPVGAPLSNLYMAVAQGGCTGQTVFKNYTIFDGSAAGANLGKIFNAVTMDGAGTLYVIAAGTLSSAQTTNDVYLFVSKDHGQTWSKPMQVNRPSLTANVMPAVAGGLKGGEVAIGWFGCNQTGDPNTCQKWNYYATETFDYGQTFTSPANLTGSVPGGYIHYGNICTVGIACGTPADGDGGNGNRDLADFSSAAVQPGTGAVVFAIPGDPTNTSGVPNGTSNVFVVRQTGGAYLN